MWKKFTKKIHFIFYFNAATQKKIFQLQFETALNFTLDTS